MTMFRVTGAVVATILVFLPGASQANNVTPDVIFGSGVSNGGFTVAQSGSLELGLRARLRYDPNGQPTNTVPWNGGSTYTFNVNDGNAPANRALWNFDWSVNTNTDGNGQNLNAFTYSIALTGPNGYSLTYNPFEPFRDVALGTNSTGNGGGVGRTFFDSLFGTIPGGFNVAQESSNIGFTGFGNNDPQALGQYDVKLTVSQGGSPVLANSININVVPEINGNAFAHILFVLGAIKLWLLTGVGRPRREEPVA